MRTECACCDKGCSVHPGKDECTRTATETVFRIDMQDRLGTPFCEGCAEDAMHSGVFSLTRR